MDIHCYEEVKRVTSVEEDGCDYRTHGWRIYRADKHRHGHIGSRTVYMKWTKKLIDYLELPGKKNSILQKIGLGIGLISKEKVPFDALVNWDDPSIWLPDDCSRLHADFVSYYDRAMATDDNKFIQMYQSFTRMTEIGSKGGCIVFDYDPAE